MTVIMKLWSTAFILIYFSVWESRVKAACPCGDSHFPSDYEAGLYTTNDALNSSPSYDCPCHDVETSIDAVSLALALQAQQDSKIREEKLQFGPNRLPLDGRPAKLQSEFPEGGLHTLNKDIVELKQICYKKPLTLAEEAARSYIAFEDPTGYEYYIKPHLSYEDVGYQPEIPKCAEFIPGSPVCSSPDGVVIYKGPATKEYPIPPKHYPCDYQPGNIYICQNPLTHCPSAKCGCN